MDIKIITKGSFDVIGKVGQGKSDRGYEWVPPLWGAANNDFEEIKTLAKLDQEGNMYGMWGAMSDINNDFKPWGEEGKYLAGCEVVDDAHPPKNWTKWTIPAYKYITVTIKQDKYGEVFNKILNTYFPQNDYNLVGAVHEYYKLDTASEEVTLYFPIEQL